MEQHVPIVPADPKCSEREGPGQSGVDLITVRGDIADSAVECQKNDVQLKVKKKKCGGQF